MPIYEYQCQACGHRLEKLQKISDPPLSDCPECSRQELQKLVSAAGFRLKGGGWYETDFKSGSKKNVLNSSDGSGGDSGSSGSSSNDKAASDTKSSSGSSDVSKAAS